MPELPILTKENINEVCSKLEILFSYGSYGLETEEYSPCAVRITEQYKNFPEGIGISVDTASMGSNTIVIPFGAEFYSSENEDTNWNKMASENPDEMPSFCFRWSPDGGTVIFRLNVSGTAVQFTTYNGKLALCDVFLA